MTQLLQRRVGGKEILWFFFDGNDLIDVELAAEPVACEDGP